MTNGEYPYPADEFDEVEAGAGPRGVHRTLRSGWSKTWPFLLVLLVFPALAYGAVTYWSGAGDGPTSAPTSGVIADPSTESPAATPTPTATAPPAETPTPAPAPTPDLATPVQVLNATNTSGLAAGAQEVLADEGWQSVTTGDYTGASVAASTVRYESADLEVTARAAADLLGIASVELDDSVTAIEIVLESDYTP